MIKNIFKSRLFFPLLLLLAFGSIFVVYAVNYYMFPEILSVEPNVAYPGEIITIEGANFGNIRRGAEVRIAGARPRSDSYELWSDSRIVVRIPEDVGSGMVTVKNRRGMSNGVLFTNRDHIPVILSGPQRPGFPYLKDVEPQNGSIGSMITISGLNFGHERGDADVFFTAAGIGEGTSAIDENLSGMIICSEIDYDYESWDEQQVRVYIPDGASSGNIRIMTDRGLSNALYFEVTGNTGAKVYSDKAGFQLEYGVELSGVNADADNGLDLWIPLVRESLEQRSVEVVAEPLPLWNDYLGLARYHFDDLEPSQSYSISIKTWLERYSIETRINDSRLRTWYDEDRRLYKVYTAAADEIPSDDELISSTASSVVRRENNPYRKASLLYNELLKRLEYRMKPSSSSIIENLNDGQGDSYSYTMLFTALCRAAGIPARPVAGLLVYNNKQSSNHYWAEFYIEGFGWIPVDPTLGDGAQFGNFPGEEQQNPAEYYFGNLDNRHISLTKGIVPVKQIAPEGRISGRKGFYSLQSIYEESYGINSYSSFWRAVRIIDWW